MTTPFALEHALAYAKLGWSVIPIRPDKKAPPIKWKPYQTKRPTPEQIKTWFNKWPTSNIGIVTGPASNLCSLDFDTVDSIESFRYTVGDIPDSLRFETGNGMQVLFSYPPDIELRNQAAIAKNIDFRGLGGLIVVPPSIHKSGKTYTWIDINPIDFGIEDLLDIPDYILTFIQNGHQAAKTLADKDIKLKVAPVPPFKPKKDPEWIQEALMGVTEGSRNDTGARVAGYFFNLFDHEKNCLKLVTQSTLNWNKQNQPPLSDPEVMGIIKSIGERHGTRRMSHLIQKKIHAVQKLYYPDGDIRYNIYFDTHDQPVHLTADEFISSMRFRTRMMQATDKIIKPIKNEVYWPILEQVLSEAQHIEMREDETKISVIRDFIWEDLHAKAKYKKIEIFLKNNSVEYDGHIYTTLIAISDRLKFSSVKTDSQKELGNLLRKMGFKPSTKFKNIRTWRIQFDSFKEL